MKPTALTLVFLLSLAGLAPGETARKSPGKTRSVPHKAEVESDDAASDTPKKNSQKPPVTTEPIEEKILEGAEPAGLKRVAAVSSIEPEELANFENYAPQIQQLVRNALDLTKLNLTYTFGSADPAQGGMDCSGTVVYLLKGLGLKGVPRQSDEICGWVQERTLLHRVTTAADSLKHAEFSALQPGDLLFWSGTYVTAPRKIPVTHVMIYLGKLKKNGRHVVFGASDGRAYQGERRTGVSVFDFSLPRIGGPSTFYGYGLIPAAGKIPVKPPEAPEIAGTSPSAEPIAEKKTPEIEVKKEPLKTEVAAVKVSAKAATQKAQAEGVQPGGEEEVRRALPAGAVAGGISSEKTAASKAEMTTTKRSAIADAKDSDADSPKVTATAKSGTKVQAKPMAKATPAQRPAKKRTPPRELTTKEKIERTANRFADSVRNVFSE